MATAYYKNEAAGWLLRSLRMEQTALATYCASIGPAQT
jgi:hypothetical protein